MKKYLFIFPLAIYIILLPIKLSGQEIPPFKIIGKYQTSLTLLVPAKTTDAELKKLIFKFREARVSNELSRLIPPTTPKGSKGSYAVVDIYVFSEEIWASSEKLGKFIRTSMKSKSDREFSREYANHIRAYYFYSIPASEETGSIGYDDGMDRSKKYKKLF